MQQKNTEIELYRFLMCTAILILHCSEDYFEGHTFFLPRGYLAVEFFFLLSGYLLYEHFRRMDRTNSDDIKIAIYLKTGLWDINGQPTLISRELFEKATNPPYGFALDLYYYYCAKKMKYKVRRFASVQKDRVIGTSSWNTGLDARIKLIKRTIRDSKAMRKENIG